MKYYSITLLILGIFFSSCQEKTNKKAAQINTASIDIDGLKKLTHELYKWVENNNSMNDFIPLENGRDSFYTGLDVNEYKLRIKELENTNLFAEQFIQNYSKIFQTIDSKMKDGSMLWNIGEMPPFGNGANPWCDCQDHPDQFWKVITLKKILIQHNIATFYWTWGGDFEYKVEAVMQNNRWKISYLEGFDIHQFIPSN